MDDICLAGSDDTIVDDVVASLKTKYDICISERFDRFLTILVEDSGDKIKQHNVLFVERLGRSCGMAQCNPFPASLTAGLDLLSTITI